MAIQIYYTKNNFEVQKARRFLKERRISFSEVDLNRHELGPRELKLFAQAAGGMRALVDTAAKGERADYVRQLSIDEYIADELIAATIAVEWEFIEREAKGIFCNSCWAIVGPVWCCCQCAFAAVLHRRLYT